MTVERVNPPSLPAPSGFSHAVVGHGTTIFLAGQTALDQHGRIVETTIVEAKKPNRPSVAGGAIGVR